MTDELSTVLEYCKKCETECEDEIVDALRNECYSVAAAYSQQRHAFNKAILFIEGVIENRKPARKTKRRGKK